MFFEQLQFIKFVYDRNSPPIEIAAFHGTSLLLIILLSLKAESKLVLHSSNLQSYPLSHHCIPFAPLRIPPPQILLGTYRVLLLELQERWKKNKRNEWKKRRFEYAQQSNCFCWLFRPFNSEIVNLSKATNFKNLALAIS